MNKLWLTYHVQLQKFSFKQFSAGLLLRNESDNVTQYIHPISNESNLDIDRNTSEILKNLVNDVKSLNKHVVYTDQNLDDFFFMVNGLLVLC